MSVISSLPLIEIYSTEEKCEALLFQKRFPNGFLCPRCEHESCYLIRTRKLYQCKECGTQVSVTAGTVMHKSKLPLIVWFRVIELLTAEKSEYSAVSLAEKMGINYRTARLLLNKIQLALGKKSQSNHGHVFDIRGLSKSFLSAIINNTVETTKESVYASGVSDSASGVSDSASDAPIITKVKRIYRKGNYRRLTGFDFRFGVLRSYSQYDLIMNWLDAFTSVILYPSFLRCWQVF